MSTQNAGLQAPSHTNTENPRVPAEESKHVGHEPEGLTFAPDRPPTSPATSTPPAASLTEPAEPKPRRPRGFAAMDRKVVSEIARKGGKAAHSAGTAHEFTSDEAREAGRKGGRATHAKRKRTGEGAQASSEAPKSE